MSLMTRWRVLAAHGAEEQPAMYLASTSATSIVLPFTPNDAPIIEADCYVARTAMAGSGAYIPILSIGSVTSPGFYIKNWGEARFDPRSWSGGGAIWNSPPWVAYRIDYGQKTVSVTNLAGNTVLLTFSGNTANANSFVLRLNDLFMTRRLTVTIGGAVAYDLVAASDGSSTACLKDLLTGNCYYDVNGAAVLTLPPQ